MTSDWLPSSISHFLDYAYDALSKRETFLNVDRQMQFYTYHTVLLLKSCVVGYGMVHVVPQPLTYLFLLFQVSVSFLLSKTWFFIAGETSHAVTQLGILYYVQDVDEYAPSFPNIVLWYYYCSIMPTEFFVDWYFFLTALCYIGKSYYSRPHKLTSFMCVLFAANWLVDQFVSGVPSVTLDNLIFYYMPLVVTESFAPEDDLGGIPHAYGSMWMIIKLVRSDLNKTPAGRLRDSLEMKFKDWSFTDYLDEISKRKSFLNVDENNHCVIFNILLLLKSFMATYAMRNIVGVTATVRMILINFLFAICDRSVYVFLASFIRFVFISGYQYVLHIQKYHMALSSGIWYWVSCDNHFHFFLDIYLIISALVSIDRAYREDSKVYTLLFFLYLIEWFADIFIGQPFSRIATIATLYFPVLFISSCTAISSRNRIFAMLVFISLWLLFKHEEEYFEYAVNKYIFNFYETAKAFVVNTNEVVVNLREL